ncbi:MAG: hypothetical protein R2849_00580 [Thermomicrobiales bacterium]
MRHQTIASFAALIILALIAGGSLAIVARQSDGEDRAETDASGDGFAGYTLTGTIGGPLIPTAPVDVAVTRDGRIFVADIGLNRVLAFTPGGDLDTSWSDDGMSERLVFPAGLALGPDDSLYVLQLGNAEVHTFDKDGNPGSTWSIGDNQGVAAVGVPTAIGIDAGGTVYVPDQRSQLIRRYSSEGDELDSWPLPLEELDANEIWPRDIISWDGRMLMTYQNIDGTDGGMIAFSADGTTEIVDDALTEQPDSESYVPAGLAVDQNGDLAILYLSDNEDESPLIGTAEAVWQPAGIPAIGAINGLILPGLAWESNGLLLVSDPDHQRIRIFRANGSIAGDIQSTSGDIRFAGLDEITIGPDGTIYAADPLLGRVTATDPNGIAETIFPVQTQKFHSRPATRRRMRMAVDGIGAVYVVDEFTDRITKFRQDGEILTEDWIADDDPDTPYIAVLAAGDEDRLYAVSIDTQDQIDVFTSEENLGALVETFQRGRSRISL